MISQILVNVLCAELDWQSRATLIGTVLESILFFLSNTVRTFAEFYGSEDAEKTFVDIFVKTYSKVMTLIGLN